MLPDKNISGKILTSLKILPELQLQNLDQTMCSKPEQKFCFMTKPKLPKLQQTLANMTLIINISNSNTSANLKYASSHARVKSIKFTNWDSVNY